MVSPIFSNFSSKLEEIKTLFSILTATEKIDGLKLLTATLNSLQFLIYGRNEGIPEPQCLTVQSGGGDQEQNKHVHFIDSHSYDIPARKSLGTSTEYSSRVQNGSSHQGQKENDNFMDTYSHDIPAGKSVSTLTEYIGRGCDDHIHTKQKISTRKRKQTEPKRAGKKPLVSRNKPLESVSKLSCTRKSSRLRNARNVTFSDDELQDYLNDVDNNLVKSDKKQLNTITTEFVNDTDSKKERVQKFKICRQKKYQISRKLVIKACKSKDAKVVGPRRGNSDSNQCSKCKESFPCLESLLLHVVSHGDVPMSCLSCHQVFMNKIQMDSHKCQKSIQRFRINKSFKKSDLRLQKYSDYSLHEKTVPKWRKQPKAHTCQYCGKTFRSKCFLYSHFKQHADGMYICQACGKFFSTSTEYRQHILTHQGESAFLCLRCGMKYCSGEYYDKHYRNHKAMDCNMCTFIGDDQQELEGHLCNDHNITWDRGPIWYQCEECNEKFSRRSLLDIHRKLHMDCKPIECSPCQMYFTSKKSLDVHKMSYRHSLKTGGATNDERKYLCSVCGKTYFRKHALQRHMLLHSGKKPHKCVHCNFRSTEVNNLKRHMALHFEAERNFVCEICGAAFHARKTLEMHHTYKHSDVRAFACDQCEMTFKAKNTLVRHMKVHSSDKQHRCWCGTAFKRMYNLRRHLQTVHDNHDSHILPPVKRVKTLDRATKAPVSRTDLVQGSTVKNQTRRSTGKRSNNEFRITNKVIPCTSHTIDNYSNSVSHTNTEYLGPNNPDCEIQEPARPDFFTPMLNSVNEQGKVNPGLPNSPLVTHDHRYYDHISHTPITSPTVQGNNMPHLHTPNIPIVNSNPQNPLPTADTALRTRYPSVESLYSNMPYPSSLDNSDPLSIQGGSGAGSTILKQLLTHLY